jgi:hypothetical protein
MNDYISVYSFALIRVIRGQISFSATGAFMPCLGKRMAFTAYFPFFIPIDGLIPRAPVMLVTAHVSVRASLSAVNPNTNPIRPKSPHALGLWRIILT